VRFKERRRACSSASASASRGAREFDCGCSGMTTGYRRWQVMENDQDGEKSGAAHGEEVDLLKGGRSGANRPGKIRYGWSKH
jgi:hypothetical protein